MAISLIKPLTDKSSGHEIVKAAGQAEDVAYDALEAFANALYEELVLVQLMPLDKADLAIRATLAKVGEELAHDWSYTEQEC